TLKGSGRVVGARRIGDFAWAVENLLNRIIDGTLDRSSPMLATLKEAVAALPALVAELDGRGSEVADLAALAARLESHAAGPAGPAAKGAAAPEPTLVLKQPDVFAETERIDLADLKPPQAAAGSELPATPA